jgi:hypothetical protein
MPAPFTSPVARSVPFDNTTNGYTSLNVQDAIEESALITSAKSRYVLLAHYGGNASTGRFLEMFPAQASNTAPIFLEQSTNIYNVTLQTTATSATCTMSVYDLNVSSTVPVYSISLAAQKRKSLTGMPLATMAAGALLAIKVSSGSINTPLFQITLGAA